MSDGNNLERQILRTRIRFALRRATGSVFDIDAMLRKPELRASRIRIWRDVVSEELNSCSINLRPSSRSRATLMRPTEAATQGEFPPTARCAVTASTPGLQVHIERSGCEFPSHQGTTNAAFYRHCRNVT